MLYSGDLYPCGEVIEGSYEECKSKGLFGIYTFTINQDNLRYKKIPDSNGSTLNWDPKGDITRVLCTFDAYELEKLGCKVEVHDEEYGFYYNALCEGPEIFKGLKVIGDMKTLQDQYKKVKDSRYNPTLRNMCKIILNAASGKPSFARFLDIITLVKTNDDLLQL